MSTVRTPVEEAEKCVLEAAEPVEVSITAQEVAPHEFGSSKKNSGLKFWCPPYAEKAKFVCERVCTG